MKPTDKKEYTIYTFNPINLFFLPQIHIVEVIEFSNIEYEVKLGMLCTAQIPLSKPKGEKFRDH